MTYHAKLSPSGADRWATCAGSVVLAADIHDEGSQAAAMGTAKHWVSSLCLQGTPLAEFLGETVLLRDGDCALASETTMPLDRAQFSFLVDDAFAGDVAKYINAVTEYAKDGQLWVEEAVPVDHMTGEKGATGMADAIILTPDGELQVHDAKFGYTEVDVIKNRQLMMYASGAWHRQYNNDPDLGAPKNLRIVIHQPAHGPATEYAFSLAELVAFETGVQDAAARVDEAIANAHKWVGKSLEYLNPSEKACKWCRANATCPALDHLMQQQIGASPEDVTVTKTLPAFPDDLAALGRKFALFGLVEDWIKAGRAKVESLLLKHNNDAETTAALGAKLVEGRQGARKWASEDEAEKTLKALRLKKDEMYDYSLISPTTAEKLLATTPKRWTRVQPLITRADGKPSVAPLSDKRPALVIKPVADGFEDISDDGGASEYV